MRDRVMSLAECREFSLTLQVRPPRLVHGTLLLCVALLVTAVSWAALTGADLVVRTTGRVRPVDAPKKVSTANGVSPSGRVVAVNFRPGDEVRAGDILVKLDTERIENEIARKGRTIRAADEELAQILLLEKLQEKQYLAVRAKATAELRLATAEAGEARKRQATEVRQAQAEVDAAVDDLTRTRRLAQSAAATSESLVKAQTAVIVARSKLDRAMLPTDEGKVNVAREALVVAERDGAVKREELASRLALKRGEVDAARLELANLELERRESVLRSPMDGVVTSGELRPGDVVEAGKVVVEVAEQKGFRFEALVPSEEMAHVRVGMPARVRLDAFDHQRYGTLTGTVCHVAPDSTVPEGKQAASYVVRIELDGEEIGHGEERGRVKLGMAGQVEVVTDRQSLLGILMKKIRQTISLG